MTKNDSRKNRGDSHTMNFFYVGERIRTGCVGCGKTFQTTIISPRGNHKNEFCRECKQNMKCEEREEEEQELDAQEKRAKIDSLKTGTYGKTCQCQACTEREKRRTSLKKIRGIVKLEERQRIRMTLDKEIKKYLKRMSEQKEPSDIFEESKEWYKERLENMERLDEWNEKECDKIIAKQAEETAN